MTVQQSARFFEADEGSLKALLQDFLDSALEEEGNEQPFVAKDTEKERDRVWAAWIHVIEIWRKLVAAADHRVLRLERREARKQGPPMICFFSSGSKKANDWILKELSPLLRLEINTLYVKVEATAADIILILSALYQRENDIPATPLERVSFHAALVHGSVGGFRTRSVLRTTFGGHGAAGGQRRGQGSGRCQKGGAYFQWKWSGRCFEVGGTEEEMAVEQEVVTLDEDAEE
ncbi:hypothetical protein N0V88_005552 [Collariella sp. IMI 366227]|nr:hypothetical protein N0V88_005552 [Collariella sp. IMI 366227]